MGGNSAHELIGVVGLQNQNPALLKLRNIASAYPPWQKLRSHGAKPRFGRNFAFVEFFQAFAPPSELDRAQDRLSGANDDVRHRIFEVEQRIESRPQLNRPIEPDEVAIPDFSDR